MSTLRADVVSRMPVALSPTALDRRLRQCAAALIPDAELMDLILSDARELETQEAPVTLERYLSLIEDLRTRPDPLDAAVHAVLTCGAVPGISLAERSASLSAAHPELAAAIAEAAALTEACTLATQLEALVQIGPAATLPAQFGPASSEGNPRYVLTKLLGSGASGHVYLAQDTELSDSGNEALVAIKVLTVGARSNWRVALEEASKVRRIDHPSVVRVIDRALAPDGQPYIVYEHVPGGDLSRWLRDRSLPMEPRAAARFIRDLAAGLHAAHLAGLFHGDIKPQNVLVTSTGHPKLADFGAAGRLEPDAPSPTIGLGNVAFMAPERYRMSEFSGILADIYSLGGLLYHLLTGELPNGRSIEEVGRNLSKESGRTESPSARAQAPVVPKTLDAICRRAMSLRAEDRQQSAESLADDLNRFLSHRPIEWTSPTLIRRAALWGLREPLVAGAMVAVALAMAFGWVGFGWMKWAQKRDTSWKSANAAMGSVQLPKERIDIRGEFLEFLWAFEWIEGPRLLDHPEELETIFSQRAAVAKDAIDELVAAGRDMDIETAMWRIARAFWLTNRTNDEPEALAILTGVRGQLASVLNPGDHLLMTVDTLIDCASAKHLYLTQKARPNLTPAVRRRLEELRSRLTADEALCASCQEGSPVHLMVLRSLRALYSKPLLNDSARSHQADLRIWSLRWRPGLESVVFPNYTR